MRLFIAVPMCETPEKGPWGKVKIVTPDGTEADTFDIQFALPDDVFMDQPMPDFLEQHMEPAIDRLRVELAEYLAKK